MGEVTLGISAKDAQQIAEYLIKCPYKDVAGLVNILAQLKPVSVTGQVAPTVVTETKSPDA